MRSLQHRLATWALAVGAALVVLGTVAAVLAKLHTDSMADTAGGSGSTWIVRFNLDPATSAYAGTWQGVLIAVLGLAVALAAVAWLVVAAHQARRARSAVGGSR